MTITANDIKIMASERLNDDLDGGGFMTGVVVQDNVENNLFPDVSALDRAQGAMDFRKVYPCVLSDDSDYYFGAHVIITEAPADPAVSVVLTAGNSLSQVRSELIGASLATSSFYGIKPVNANLSVGGQQVEVGSLTTRFIPSTSLSSSAAGSVVTSSSGVRNTYYPFSGTETFSTTYVSGLGSARQLYAKWPGLPTSASGAFSATQLNTSEAKTDGVVSSTSQGYAFASVTFTSGGAVAFPGPGYSNSVFTGSAYFILSPNPTQNDVTAATATYTPMVELKLPVTTEVINYTSAMTPVVSPTLTYVPAIGSELVEWTDINGLARAMSFASGGTYTTLSGTSSTATVDRSAKSLVAILDPAPKVGTDIKISYCRTGYVTSITAPASFIAIDCTVTLATDTALSGGRFTVNGADYMVRDSIIYRWNPSQGQRYDVIVGSWNPTTNVLRIPELGSGTKAITNWKMAAVSTLFPTSNIDGGSIPPNLNPATLVLSGKKSPSGTTWTSSSNANGTFSDSLLTGSYNKTSGVLALTFSEPVSSVISYSSTQFTYTPINSGVTGVDPSTYASNGEVAVFKTGNVVVVHNEVTMAPATVINGQVVSTRANIADVRVIGTNGVEITTGFTVNKVTGAVTFNLVTGYSQPVTIKHRIEDLSVLTAATADGRLTLSKPLTNAYTAGVSFVSSAYIANDLQGRARQGFQQASWTGVWSDTALGLGILADYNEPAYPITMKNKGSIKERWALIFTGSANFKIVGEQVGEIGSGTISSITAPVNPATGGVYFSIDPLGWGAGWAIGNVYRFNTEGANFPMWFIRSINPSNAYVGQDKATLAVRGDINA